MMNATKKKYSIFGWMPQKLKLSLISFEEFDE